MNPKVNIQSHFLSKQSSSQFSMYRVVSESTNHSLSKGKENALQIRTLKVSFTFNNGNVTSFSVLSWRDHMFQISVL